jgi:hypothetical protein
MPGIGMTLNKIVTHPFGFRLGTWLIQEEMRADEMAEAEKALNEARASRPFIKDIDALEKTVDELKMSNLHAHDVVFNRICEGHDIIGIQGCGDLTMNAWNVAYVNSDLGVDRKSGQKPPVLVCIDQEKEHLAYRTYSCLVKWKSFKGIAGRVTIEEVQFRPKITAGNPNEMVWVRFGNKWLPRGDLIEFAVSNQQVIRDGEIVSVVTTCHQFGDLRHLIQMPNLNPEGPLYPGEPIKHNRRYRPRQYFNRDQEGDIWLGEAFLKDESQNLLRAALSGPVYIDFPPDCNETILRGALNLAGYREVSSALGPLSPGDWRFAHRSLQETVLEIYFKRNTYGWTMIGLSSDNRRILCLACTGKPGKIGYTLEQAAEVLLRAGAHNALLMDEGKDVFQKVRWEDGRLISMIPPARHRLRAVFIIARPCRNLAESDLNDGQQKGGATGDKPPGERSRVDEST